MTKRILLFIIIVSAMITAQEKVVHFKKLQEYLPSLTVQKFKREKPTGSTSSVMGFTVSTAEVRYTEEIPETDYETSAKNASIKITDATLYQAALISYLYLTDYENETEDGYEKSYMVNEKYRGTLRVTNGEYKSASITFAVGQRFLLEVSVDNSDSVDFLLSFINDMNLDSLSTLRAE